MIQAASALLIFVSYFFFLPHSVTLEDSGEMLMVANSFGIAHQPGYPLMGLIGGVVANIPTGNPAFNIHLLSAFFGALTLLFVYKSAFAITNDQLSSLFAMFLAATAPTVLWFSTVAEVYTQFTFLFFWCFYLALREEPKPWMFLLVGLGLTAHPALFVLSMPALIILRPQSLLLLKSPKAVLFLLLGLSPFLYLFWRGTGGDYLAMGQIRSFDEWFTLITMQQMGMETRFTLADQIGMFGHTCWLLLRDLAGIGTLLAAIGLFSLIREGRQKLFFALLWLILVMNVVLQLMQQSKYDILFSEQAEQFHVQTIIAATMAAAIGAQWLFKGFSNRLKALSLAAVIALSIGWNWRFYERDPQSRFASEIARTYLSVLPPNSLLLLHGDSDVGPMTYVNRIEGVLPDVKLVSQNGFLLRPPGVDNRENYVDKLVAYVDLELRQGVRVFALRLRGEVRATLAASNINIHDLGIYSEVSRTPQAFPMVVPQVKDFADRYASGELKSKHWIYYHEALVGPICKYLAQQKVNHPILETTVYCRYYSLQDSPPADAQAAKVKAQKLAYDARNFPDDEKAAIQSLTEKF